MFTHKKIHPNPVMAVLINPKTFRHLQKQIVIPRIKLLVEANKEVKNNLYYFSIKQVKLKERKITGCYWHGRYNRWSTKEFPFPDILYIRGEVKKKYIHIFNELIKIVNSSGKVINHPRFNKWQLYNILSKDPALNSYLPVTREVNQPEDIEKMLQEYKVIYLKPQLGRKGQNVLRVDVLSGGSYRYSYFKHAKPTIQTVFSFQSLIDVINNLFRGKSFLVQQSIELMKTENRLIDMRAELQRNGDGGVEIAGISVRLGQPGSPVTTHADAFKFDDFLENKLCYSKGKIDTLQSKVNDFLFGIFNFIEKNYGEYVEIGIDFAIDTRENIWFIEANSQSTKVSLEKAFDSTVLSRAYKNILEYARYLYNQTHRDNESCLLIEANSQPVSTSWKWPDGTVLCY